MYVEVEAINRQSNHDCTVLGQDTNGQSTGVFYPITVLLEGFCIQIGVVRIDHISLPLFFDINHLQISVIRG